MTQESFQTFRKKAWTITGIVSFTIVVLLVLKTAFNILLLILAASLVAILFRGTADYMVRKTGMKRWLAMTLTLLGTLLLLAGMTMFVGARIQTQLATLTDKLPEQVERAKTEVSKTPLGKRMVERINAAGGGGESKVMKAARTFLSSTLGVAGDMYVIILVGLFFTATPMIYVDGMVRLIPVQSRKRGREVIEKVGGSLYKWLVGKIFAMAVVAVLTYIGLLALGVPLALALALIAGLLSFIPNFGPIIALVPAVLIALIGGPQDALWVVGLFIAVQVVESNLITPLIQKKLLQIPPAVIIIAQIVIGLFSGGIGLIVATPLVVILMVVVQELYLKPMESSVAVQTANAC